MTFLVSLVRHTAVLFAAAAVGALIAAPWVPGGGRLRLFSAERAAWGVAVGLALVAGTVPLALLVGVRPGWIVFLVLAAAAAAASLLRPAAGSSVPEANLAEAFGRGASAAALRSVIVVGIALLTLRALTEPMWSNDFLAIWGLKGKMIYALSAVPDRLHADPSLAFSHPEYPLGIPFLYAGLASLAGGWDDHAAAVLFPILQAATLLARAESVFTETDMKLHAATAHWTRNHLIGDAAGTGSTLDRVFEAEGVRCPSRMAATLAPGPWHL